MEKEIVWMEIVFVMKVILAMIAVLDNVWINVVGNQEGNATSFIHNLNVIVMKRNIMEVNNVKCNFV